MSRALLRTENTNRRASSPVQSRGTFTRHSFTQLAPLIGRLACGLLAAIHIAPLLRVSRHVVEQGPTPALLATWAVLALLVVVLAAKAAGLVFFRAGSRRVSIISLVLAAALFHGDVVISKDAAPATVAILTTTGAAATIPFVRKIRDSFTGRAPSLKDLFRLAFWGYLQPQARPAPLQPLALTAARHRGPPVPAPLRRA